MDQTVTGQTADAAQATAARMKDLHKLNAREAGYMQGAGEPVTSSVLISSSKYLNNPYYRDIFAQFSLRKFGTDVPPTYQIPDMVRALGETRDNAEFYRLVQEERAKKPEFAAWLDRRRLTTYRAEELREYRAGTLGACIRQFLENSGMQMEFMNAELAPANDLEYMIKRRSANHDIEHMVTGFGPNGLGEGALAVMGNVSVLKYFSPKLAHYLNEFTMFVTATGLYRKSLHAPEIMLDTYRAWALAIAAGEAIARPLMLVDWEDYLHMTPDEIAEELGFKRGPGAAWDQADALIRGY
jgi:ubiquinone biosynthesis protein Coq4